MREVKAELRVVDEPLLWHLSGRRAFTATATATATAHLWLRILDVPARIGFDVSDALGFTEGQFLLETNDAGVPQASSVDEFPAYAAAVALSVNELSSLYLGE